MHSDHLYLWQHSHAFGQDRKKPGERRTLIVIVLTGVTMVVEIAAGVVYGSMALLADGLHMGSHAMALGVTAFAYVYARRHAHDTRFSFGTGKVNALGGFSGAILLALFAFIMVWESIVRLIEPVQIVFNQAIFVAVLGLLVNGISVLILGVDEHHGEGHQEHAYHHDHNLKSAYLHVMADALTSVLAIIALLAAKYFGFIWMDPVMGLVGAALVTKWSYGLLQSTSHTLLDRQGPEEIRRTVKEYLESDQDTQVADLHLWSIGPGLYACVVKVVAHEPVRPEEYKARIPEDLGLVHVSIEIHQCHEDELS